MQGEVTFFHTDSIEKLTVREVARIAEERGFRTRFSERLHEPAEIGVYCSHNADPSRSKFSVVMLHDLGQRHDVWPHFWSQEPWNRYDVGFVPGATWVDRFLSAKRVHRFLAPKHGIYAAGWPKADPIFDATGSFQAELARMRTALALEPSKPTVLYAPSWENDGKQDEFVNAALAVDCNVVIKQADWPLSTHAHIAKNISDLEAKYRDHPRVKTIDRKTSIMFALALADVIVSEESSVMVEALLFGVPAIAVVDWTIPDRNPPRLASVPFDFVRKISKVNLTAELKEVLARGHYVHYRGLELALKDYSNLWFSQRGRSAELIMDVVQALLEGRRPSAENICERPGYDDAGQSLLLTALSYLQARTRYHAQGPQRVERELRRIGERLLRHG